MVAENGEQRPATTSSASSQTTSRPSSSGRGQRSGGPSRGRRFGGRRFRGRRRAITGCSPRCLGYKGQTFNYKQVDLMKRYVSARGKIQPRRQSGTCAKHQRALAREIKRARFIALLPFTSEHVYTGR